MDELARRKATLSLLARISEDYAIMERALQTIADGFCSQVDARHLAMKTLTKLQATAEDVPVASKEDGE